MTFNKERISLNDGNQIEILYPIHEIDSFNGEELKNYICSIENEISGVIINFSKITYLNSSGIRELIQILKYLREKDKNLVLSCINDDINKIFIHTNLDRLFKIVIDDDEAKAVF